jgi:hypothetical protein
MSSNTNTTKAGGHRTLSRFSLDGGSGGGEEEKVNDQNCRKRKQAQLEVGATDVPEETKSGKTVGTSDDSDDDDDDDDDEEDEDESDPRRDKEDIVAIITKRLWLKNDNDAVEKAMYSLCNLVDSINFNFEENRKIAILSGGPLAIVKAMRRHENPPEIQQDGCFSLGVLVTYNVFETQHAILEIGGLKACLSAMKRHSTIPIVQVADCLLIANVCCHPELH